MNWPALDALILGATTRRQRRTALLATPTFVAAALLCAAGADLIGKAIHYG